MSGLTQGELERRKRGLGGSEIAAIMGLNPWKSAYQVWEDKTGRSDGEKESTEAMDWGLRLEDAVARRFADPGDIQLLRLDPDQCPMVHPVHEWMIGSPDRLIRQAPTVEMRLAEPDGGVWEPVHALNVSDEILEVKTTRYGREFGADVDDVPQNYLLQLHHYMGIARATLGTKAGDRFKRGRMAVLIGGSEYRSFVVDWSNQLYQRLLEAGGAFWENHVLADIPPDPDRENQIEFSRWIRSSYPSAEGKKVLQVDDLSDGSRAIAETCLQVLSAAKAAKTAAESDYDKAQLDVQEIMRDHYELVGACGKARWGNRAGQIAWKKIATVLADRLGMTKAELDALADKHRGSSSRTFSFIPDPEWMPY